MSRWFPGKFNRSHYALVTSVVTCLWLAEATCQAQSTVVQLPDNSIAALGIPSVVDSSGVVPNSASPLIQRSEALLERPTPPSWRAEMPMARLVSMMNQAGFQVLLHESAMDNNLDEDALIRLALHNASIDVNLRFALEPFQCDYLIDDSGVIVIMSDDTMLDNQVRYTYNISQLAQDYESGLEVADLITETIDPDSWDENGGSGRIVVTGTGSGMMLTVTQIYRNQREVQQQLAAVQRMGNGPVSSGPDVLSMGGASTSVLLPEEYLALRRNRRGMSLP
ncbi:MAG: hypothetical protein ACR2NP_21440, partial [Pirellulaceae bacterium]